MTILDGAHPVVLGEILSQDRTSLGLSAQAARVALRIADLVEANCTPESAVPAVKFLRSWAEHAWQAGAEAADPSSPLDRLRERYGLGPLACDLLLLAGLPEEHEGLAGTFRALHPQGEPRPTLGLAARLADLNDGGLLIRRLRAPGGVIGEGLVRLGADGPLFERSIQAAPALWDALHGGDAWPAELVPVAVGAPPPGLDGWLRLPAVRRAVAALASPAARTVVLGSEDEAVVLSRCAAMAVAAGVRLVAAQVGANDVAGARLLAAHAAVRGAIPVFCVFAAQHDGGPPPSPALDLTWLQGPGLVCSQAGVPAADGPAPGAHRAARPARPGRPSPSLVAERAAPAVRRVRAGGAAPAGPGAHRRRGRRPAQPAPARRADVAGGRVGGDPEPQAGINLPPGVSLSSPTVTWDQLVLPPGRPSSCGTRSPGLTTSGWSWRTGVSASRCGPAAACACCSPARPGPARRCRPRSWRGPATDLLVVDLSRVVSKWIGETEKNLSSVFDSAERAQAVLFFDEADALFGTRTEVSDAHDRYANLETAYLLQRLERFEGLAILATNLKQNIDAAFTRRLEFAVDFDEPDREQRFRLWRTHIPEGRAARAGRELVRAGRHCIRWSAGSCATRRWRPVSWPPPTAPRSPAITWCARCAASSRKRPAVSGRTSAGSQRGARAKGGEDMSACDGTATVHGGHRDADLPVNPFLALRARFGMLLGEDDFTTLMGNGRGKLMLHSAWLHGSGVVHGYRVGVDVDTKAGTHTLRVSSGLAVDGLGRELYLGGDWCYDLATLVRNLAGEGTVETCDDERTVEACLSVHLDPCSASPVPALADPCDLSGGTLPTPGWWSGSG